MAEKYDKLFLVMKDNDEFTKNIFMLLESKQSTQDGTKTEKKQSGPPKGKVKRSKGRGSSLNAKDRRVQRGETEV